MATRLQKDLLTFLPIVISALLAFSSYALYTHTELLHHKGFFNTRQNGAYNMKAADIREFMTFDYINNSFHFPDDYLRDALKVTTSTYPYITLKSAASISQHTNKDFLSLVQEKTATYFATSTQK